MSVSTTDIATVFLEFLKLAPRYLIAFGVFAAFLLFADHEFLERVGVFEFAQNYRSVLGLILIGTATLFIVSILRDAVIIVKRWWHRKQLYRRMTERLNCLTEDEKQILRFYLAENTRANMLRIDDGVVQGLKVDGIIYQSASLGNVLEGFAHNIDDFAWDYLHVHPYLLKGTTNTYRTDKRESYW